MTAMVQARTVRWVPCSIALLLACLVAGQASGQAAPQRLWQVRFDLDHQDDRATVGTFFKRHVVAGGTTRFSSANGGEKLTWLSQWNGDDGAPRWSRDVDGISVPVRLEADRRRLFLAGYGRRPLQALSGRDGRTLWESRRGPDLLSLAWLDVAVQGRVVYATGKVQAKGTPGQVAIEARRARDGKPLWSLREPATAAVGGGWDEGRLLLADGPRLFIGGSQTTGQGSQLGFVSSRRTADGEELWRLESPDFNRLGTMEVAGNRLLLIQWPTDGTSRLRVMALDASSGSQLWSIERGADHPVSYKPGGAIVSGAILVVAIDVVGGQAQGRPNDLLYLALRIADGSELWSDRVKGAYPSGNNHVAVHGSTAVGGGVLFQAGGTAERVFRGYGRATGGLRWELRDGPFWALVTRVKADKLLVAGSVLESPTDALVRVYSLPPD